MYKQKIKSRPALTGMEGQLPIFSMTNWIGAICACWYHDLDVGQKQTKTGGR